MDLQEVATDVSMDDLQIGSAAIKGTGYLIGSVDRNCEISSFVRDCKLGRKYSIALLIRIYQPQSDL